MFFLLLPLLSLSLLLKTASSFPQPQDRSPNQNQQLANTDIDTDTETAAAAANLGDSLGAPSSQDPSAWWNQVDVKPGGGGGSDSTGPSTLSFDASSSERPAAAAATADTFLLASTSGALGLLPLPANDPNTLLDNPNTSSPSSDTMTQPFQQIALIILLLPCRPTEKQIQKLRQTAHLLAPLQKR